MSDRREVIERQMCALSWQMDPPSDPWWITDCARQYAVLRDELTSMRGGDHA